jgi:hypothetical protein
LVFLSQIWTEEASAVKGAGHLGFEKFLDI